MPFHLALRLWNFYFIHSNQPWLTPSRYTRWGRNHIYGLQLYCILGPLCLNIDLHFDKD